LPAAAGNADPVSRSTSPAAAADRRRPALAVTLHQASHAVAGAVAFAVFAAGAVIQIAMSRAGLRATLRVAPLILIPGLVLLAAGMWFALLSLFIIGGIVVGAGAALAFRGGLTAAA
jgi:hypothetical protein